MISEQKAIWKTSSLKKQKHLFWRNGLLKLSFKIEKSIPYFDTF